MLWVGTVVMVGYAVGTASLAGWAVLATLALAPLLVMMRFWGVPAPSLSQSIQEALGKSDGGVNPGARR